MAQVTITVEDDTDGMVSVTVEFEPPIENGEATAAQLTALEMVARRELPDAHVQKIPD